MYVSHGTYDVELAASLSFMAGNHVAMGLYQMLLTILVMIINQKFFISGFTSLLHKSPNMDTLVALGTGASLHTVLTRIICHDRRTDAELLMML